MESHFYQTDYLLLIVYMFLNTHTVYVQPHYNGFLATCQLVHSMILLIYYIGAGDILVKYGTYKTVMTLHYFYKKHRSIL